MINEKTYAFVTKFLIFAFIFLSISIIVQSFIFDSLPPEKNHTIPYLKIGDQTTDSVLNTMSLDEKITLFVRSQIQDSLTVPEGGDTLFSKDNLETEYLSFQKIKKQNYFNGTLDTALIIKKISNQLSSSATKNFVFYLNDFDITSTTDSMFLKFYMARFKLYKNLVHANHSLFGLGVTPTQLALLDSLQKDSSIFTKDLLNDLKTTLDFLSVDSFNTKTIIPDFEGIIAVNITDSIIENEETILKLINAQADVLLVPKNKLATSKAKVKEILLKREYNQEKFNLKIKKLVKAQIWQHQNKRKDSSSPPFNQELIDQQLVEKSIAVVNNNDSLIPLKKIHNKKFVLAWFGNHVKGEFLNYFRKYADLQLVYLKPGETNWQKKLKFYQKKAFIVYALDTLLNDTLGQNQLKALIETAPIKKSTFINFKNLENLLFIPDSFSCIQTQGKSSYDYKFSAQAIFGGLACEGALPYSISANYQFGQKHLTNKTRLKYTIAEDARLDGEKLKEIDKIAWQGINSGAFPGCQVFVAKEGKVVWNKSYGYHTYARKNSVKKDDVYDLASVTKIASTTIAAMQMVSSQRMALNDKLGTFFKNTKIDYTRIKPDTVVKIDTFFISSIQNWKEFLVQNDTLNINDTSFITQDTIITRLTPKRNIFKVPLFSLLRHKSGIVPAVPVFRYMYYKAYFLKQLKEQLAAIHGKSGPVFNYQSFKLPANFPDNTNLADSLNQAIKEGFKNQYNEYFSQKRIKDSSDIQLAKNLYFKNRYFDTIWRDIKQLPVFSRKVFQYSDVNMVLLQMAIDSANNRSIDYYLKKNIYQPLGLKTATYLPLNYYGKHKIVPTEKDQSWRFGLLHGFVHDPSAALLGGVAGNAGLYSNAHDLGILFQMVLNKGSYGGTNYIRPAIVETFTKRFDDTQRALGFDMPNRKAIVGAKASKNTFGHSGYTGTCVWVDPDNQIVYVFLSNRNHPKSTNWRISKYKIRQRIHDAIYDAFIKDESESEKVTQQLAGN